MSQGPDIITLYRGQIEQARLDNQALGLKVRYAEKRSNGASNETHHYAAMVKRKDEALEEVTGTLRALWQDLEGMHVEGCSRQGLACPACEAQGKIEGVL